VRQRPRRLVVTSVAALVALAVATVVVLVSRSTDTSAPDRARGAPATTASPTPCTTEPTTTSVDVAPPPPTATTATTATATTTTTTTTTEPVLRVGSSGPAVQALEERLVGLGFWVGEADGSYDPSTAHGVVAFQKWHGIARDGVAGPQVAAALRRAEPVRPRATEGRHVEIDLGRQVLLAVDPAGDATVLDISTGRVAGTTPVGHFTVTRQIDGYRRSPLGVLYRPKYFVGGVAVHGYPSVPPRPASHGCVRTTNAAMDWLWSGDRMVVGSAVWVYR
jgi:hypothetical protein